MELDFLNKILTEQGLAVAMLLVFGLYIFHKDKKVEVRDKEIRDLQNVQIEKLSIINEEHRQVNEYILKTNSELAESNRLLISEISNKINGVENALISIETKLDVNLKTR